MEAVDKSVVVSGEWKPDPTRSNPVNGDTAGYMGAHEVTAKVAKVADGRAVKAAEVVKVNGHEAATTVDYGNVDNVANVDGMFNMVYLSNLAFTAAALDCAKLAYDGTSVDAVFMASCSTGSE